MAKRTQVDLGLDSLNRIGSRDASSIAQLHETFEWVRQKTAEIADEALKRAQGAGALKEYVTFVDGKSGRRPADVKLWGTIAYVSTGGDVQKAIELVWDYVFSMLMRLKAATGFYRTNFHWFMNGQSFGMQPPNVERMGLKGNVQLTNLTGYASPLEFHVPGGILYGAARAVHRAFPYTVALKFGYAPADAFGPQAWKQGTKNTPPLAVPVITMGHPGAKFMEGRANVLRRPGVRYRKRLREEMSREEKRATRKKRRQEEGGSLK